MKLARTTIAAFLLLAASLALASCVVYEEPSYYGHHEGGWHGDHDRWR